MHRLFKTIPVLALVLLTAATALAGGWAYDAAPHPGKDCTPTQAMEIYLADKANTVIVDVRTRGEYMFVGHPEMAFHLPVKFLTPYLGDRGYQLKDNPDFGKQLREMFNPETQTLIFICRSGGRSATASKLAVAVGFSPERCYNMVGGFEGDTVKAGVSLYNGKRKLGGWKNEGLPWTYAMDPELAYNPK